MTEEMRDRIALETARLWASCGLIAVDDKHQVYQNLRELPEVELIERRALATVMVQKVSAKSSIIRMHRN